MNNTGHYVFDRGKRRFVKVSDTPPSVACVSVGFVKRSKRSHNDEYAEHVSHTGEHFSSRRDKHRFLKENEIAEGG